MEKTPKTFYPLNSVSISWLLGLHLFIYQHKHKGIEPLSLNTSAAVLSRDKVHLLKESLLKKCPSFNERLGMGVPKG